MNLLNNAIRSSIAVGVFAAAANVASAAIVITEVDPYGSNGSDGYSEDWFELTNTGTAAVNLSGYSMVDNHAASNTTTPYGSGATISIGNLSGSNATFGPALLTLAGTSQTIAAGQSVIFLENSAPASSSATLIGNFEKAWFGSTVPAGLVVGTYNDGASGSYGLSQTADMVNIFSGSSSSSTLIASTAFGADSGSPIATFDNTAGANNATLTQKSVSGVNGAFVSATGLEIGSPGTDAAPVPLPASAWLLLSGLGGLGMLRHKRKAA